MTVDVRETALRIGAKLGASAIWSGGACGWLGDVSGARGLATESLGASLYGGQAGVVLFLAHLAAATEDRRMTALAEGAIKLLEWQWAESAACAGSSFLLGLCGSAFVIGEAADLTQSPHLSRLAETCASKARISWERQVLPTEFLAGEAGVLTFALGRRRDGAEAIDLAWAQGAAERIALAAKRDDLGGVSWPTQRGERLAGMAHGASGAIAALARLENIAPDPARRHLIDEAMTFERRLFDPLSSNWRDMRGAGGELARGGQMIAWCHGAPGVAVARLASALRSSAEGRADADAALETTERHLRRSVDGQTMSDGLCHGAAGLADILWTAAACAPSDRGERQRSAALAWAASVDGRLSGNGSGGLDLRPLSAAPALFTGLAGVGYALLRLQDEGRPPDVLGLPA